MSQWEPPDPGSRLDEPAAPVGAPLPTEPSPTEPVLTDDDWLRLDPRMMLVSPFSALRQIAVPALIAMVGITSSTGNFSWWVLPVALIGALAAGLIPWLTTRYRFTSTQFQRRSGVISRKQLTAPLDRVRSVDLESSLLHRMLGLVKVKVGTGVDDTQIELDALGRDQAEALRTALLARSRTGRAGGRAGAGASGPAPHATPTTDHPAPDSDADPVVPGPPEELLARLDWSWVRFAPLNLARLAVVAATIGFLSQVLDPVDMVSADQVRDAWDSTRAIAWPLLVAIVAIGATLGWVGLAVSGYVLQWAGMRLTRDQETIRLTAGLLTTRSTTVEEQRIRGVRLVQPALMRLARGAELATLATGVGSGGTSGVMPPSPLVENQRVAGLLLGDEVPVVAELVPHGPRARRRLHLRRQIWTGDLTLVAAIAAWWFEQPWWQVVALAVVLAGLNALLAEAAYRQLGHTLTAGHLVSREGTLTSARTVLERDGIIGWVVTQSLFQRRAGLVTLVATTAAGSEQVRVRDVPEATAVQVAARATPTAVTGFLADLPS